MPCNYSTLEKEQFREIIKVLNYHDVHAHDKRVSASIPGNILFFLRSLGYLCIVCYLVYLLHFKCVNFAWPLH